MNHAGFTGDSIISEYGVSTATESYTDLAIENARSAEVMSLQ